MTKECRETGIGECSDDTSQEHKKQENKRKFVEESENRINKYVPSNYRSIICIFTNSGKSFTFKECMIDCSNESFLQFRYRAMSDCLYKTANFPKANICGWSETH